MSEANIRYVLAHNDIPQDKVELNPNSIKPLPVAKKDKQDSRDSIRSKYGIPCNAVVFAYGGNLGLPQGLEFLVEVCKKIKLGRMCFCSSSETEADMTTSPVNCMLLMHLT